MPSNQLGSPPFRRRQRISRGHLQPRIKPMSPEEAMERINTTLAHAWMVRNFLKHADEVQEDEEMLEVHRMIFDYIRAVEPSYQRKDEKEYLHRARGKLPKLKHAADFFAGNYRR